MDFPNHQAKLIRLVERFTEARSLEEREGLLRTYRELLGREVDALLAGIENDLASPDGPPGGRQAAAAIARNRAFLSRCRRLGIERAIEEDRAVPVTQELEPDVDATERWLRRRETSPATLAQVIACCERVADHPSFPHFVWFVRLQTWYARALARRLALRGERRREDFDREIDDYQQVVDLSPPDWPLLPEALSGLGEALTSRYEITHITEDMIRAYALFEEAARLAQGSPVYMRSVILANHGRAAWVRFGVEHDPADLDRTRDLLLEAWDLMPADAPDRAILANNLAGVFRDRYEQHDEDSELESAIKFARIAVDASPDEESEFPRRINLDSALARRYEAWRDPQDLDDAITLLEPAAAVLPLGGLDWARAVNNLATALRYRAAHRERPADLDLAIEWHEQLAENVPSQDDHRLLYLGGVANAYQQRAASSGSSDDIDTAIGIYRAALAESEGRPQDMSRLLNNLATALSSRYEVTRDAADLNAAIVGFGEALATMPASAPQRPRTLLNLGAYLTAHYELSGAEEDYRRGMAVLDEAEIGLAGTPDWAGLINNWAGARFARFRRQNVPEDLKAAISGWKDALARSTMPNDRADRERNLATAVAERHLLNHDPGDLERARDLFRRAASSGDGLADTALRAALNWGHWAFERATESREDDPAGWAEAAEAYGAARAAAERLMRVQLARGHQADWLRLTQPVPGRHAYALALSGRVAEAIVALEGGGVCSWPRR